MLATVSHRSAIAARCRCCRPPSLASSGLRMRIEDRWTANTRWGTSSFYRRPLLSRALGRASCNLGLVRSASTLRFRPYSCNSAAQPRLKRLQHLVLCPGYLPQPALRILYAACAWHTIDQYTGRLVQVYSGCIVDCPHDAVTRHRQRVDAAAGNYARVFTSPRPGY